MVRILLLFACSVFSFAASAKTFCADKLEHDSQPFAQLAAVVSRSAAFNAISKKYPAEVYCLSGVTLEYSDVSKRNIYVLEITVRGVGFMEPLERFRILVDGENVSMLKFDESEKIFRKWAAAMTYKSAGILPSLDAEDIAVRLNIFEGGIADEDSLTSLSFRFPATPSEAYSLVTWSVEVRGASMIGERVSGVVIVQDQITGDIAIADRLNFTELIGKLRLSKLN